MPNNSETFTQQGLFSLSSNNHNIVLEFLEPQGAKILIPMGFEDQICAYYKTLGFEEGESFVLRATKSSDSESRTHVFFGKLTTIGIDLWFTQYSGQDQDDIAIYKQGSQLNNPIEHLRQLGVNGFGIFSYPNHVAGGMGTKHALGFTALFYEHDKVSLDEQCQGENYLKNGLGLEPALVVFSGGKSRHVYIRLTKDIGPDRWKRLNRMLSVVMGSDPSVNTLARAMRLPSMPRVGKDGERKDTSIISQSDRIYDADFIENTLLSTGLFPYGYSEQRWYKYQSEMIVKDRDYQVSRELALKWFAIPEDELNPKPIYRDYNISYISGKGEYIPLEKTISKANREYLNGVSNNRNSTGTALAKDLYGTAQWLNSNGFQTDDPYSLFLDYCQKCSQGNGWNEREWQSIWRSATRGNPHPSTPDEGLWNCVKAYLHKENKGSNIHYSTQWNHEKYNTNHDKKSKPFTANGFIKWLEKQLKPKNKGLPKFEGTEYQDGLIQFLLNQGKSVLDARPMGSGKSYQVPSFVNPKGGKIWYITGDHRNPTIEAITNQFTDLHPRNEYGQYRDSEGKLKGKLKLAKADTPKDKILLGSKGKCIRASLFPKLSELGYDPNQGGSENPICASCPMLKTCRFTEGWYLNDRRETLSHSHIRADLESMPRNGYDYSKDLIILDDKLPNPIKTISATWGNLLLEFDRVRTYLSDNQYQEFDKVLQTLKPLFDDKTAYGLEHQAILETLVQLPLSEDILTVIATSVIDLHSVFPKPDDIELSDTDKKAYKSQIKAFYAHAHHEASKESEENLKNLPPNALVHLIKALKGESGIVLRMAKGELTLTIDRRTDFAFLNDCGSLLILNATSSLEDLKMRGITRPLEVVKGSDKVTEHNNLTVIAIHTKGLGRNPYQNSQGKIKGISDRAINRLSALDKALFEEYGYFPLIGPKPLKELFEYSGNWFNHNRGSNDFDGLPTLGYVGLPRPNLGAVKDKYLALKGTLDGFEDYYESLINQEILQGIGRPRANRHPDKQFTVLMIVPEQTDLNWLKDYGVRVVNKSAFEITPEAGTETQATAYRIVQATRDLLTQGVKATQDAIAKLAGMTQQNVSKLLRAKGLTVEMLTQKLLNLFPNGYTTGPYKDSITASCMTAQLYEDFRAFFDLPIEDFVEDAIKVIQEQGLNYFWEYLSNFPKAVQGKYLTALWHLLQTDSDFLIESLKT